MKLYLVTSGEYHDNPYGSGIFSSIKKAKAAVLVSPLAAVIHEIELDELYKEEGNSHIAPTMNGVEIRRCNKKDGRFLIG